MNEDVINFNEKDGRRIVRTVRLSEGNALHFEGADYGTPIKSSVNQSGARVAYLTQVGGSNGSTASYCTYTYNAYFDAAKTQLAGGTLTVQAHRMLMVSVTAATLGIIQVNSNNTYSLMAVLDEYFGQNACT